jgi:hypothetical protein
VVSAEAPKAGVAVQLDTEYLDGRNTEVVKRPLRLRADKPKPGMIRVAMQRMSSELCGRHVVYDELVSRVTSSFETIEKGTFAAVLRATGVLDSEDLEADLLLRARELKQCVEGTDIFLGPEDQAKWIASAKKWLEAQFANSKEWENATHRL